MKTRKIALIFFVFIMLLPNILAYTSANLYIDNDGSVTFIGQASSALNIKGVEFNQGSVSGITQELTIKNGEIWTFSLYLNDTAEIRIFLPDNAMLRIKSLQYNAEPLIQNYRDSVVLSAAGDDIMIKFDYVIGKNASTNNLLLVSGIALALFLLLLVIFLTKKLKDKRKKQHKKKKIGKKSRKIDIVKKTLNEREQLIIGNLLNLKMAKQNFLQKKIQIPKASFSRHIKNLQSKGVIEVEAKGKSNLLKINKEMMKKI